MERSAFRTSPGRREFLFLQGLAGFFFWRLARALRARGHGTFRINFNGGDRLCWPGPWGADFRGGAADWPAFVEQVMRSRRVTDLLLFGDCRPMHRAAISVARRLGISVHVFDEGYIRPGWATLQRDGVNGFSRLPRDPAFFLAAAGPSPERAAAVPSRFSVRAINDVAYNIACLIGRPWFPRYRTHRPWSAFTEYAGWCRRFAGGRAAARRSRAALAELGRSSAPCFLFPLQLDCDYQIREHSPFAGMDEAVSVVLSSFAACAPASARLVVKRHPLDNGLRDWRRIVAATARSLGIEHRVRFIECGELAPLAAASDGVVTVNSTSGLEALALGVPVIALGHAVYDVQGATFGGPLDAFWSGAPIPDPVLVAAIRSVLQERCLIRGGFFGAEAVRMLVRSACLRLERPEPRPWPHG